MKERSSGRATLVEHKQSGRSQPAGRAVSPGMSPAEMLGRYAQDDTVELALRIEAAKALLQRFSDHRLPQGD